MPKGSQKGWRRFLPEAKTLFRWHGWLGLNLGLVLFIICFSGTIAVVAWEIDWLLDPAMRVEVRDAPYDWQAVVDGVEEDFPLHQITFIDGPRHPGFAALVYATAPDGTRVKVWTDPVTGEVQGRGNFWTVQRFFRSFHRRMFVPGGPGLLLVTIFGAALLLSALTGFLFYKNWRRNLFRLRTTSLRIFLADLHKQVGVWTLLFTGAIVVTSAWYFVEVFAPAEAPRPPAVPEMGAPTDVVTWRSLTDLAREAEASYPGFRVSDIIFLGPRGPLEFRGQATQWLVRDRANRVWIDPRTGEVLRVQRGDGIGLYHRWSDTADPLHFGTFAGLWSQAFWFLFGLALSALALTGGWLWNRRMRLRGVGPGEDPPPGMNRVWRRTSLGLALGILAIAAGFGVDTATSYMGTGNPSASVIHRAEAGPWTVHAVALDDTTRGGRRGAEGLFVRIASENGVPHLRSARLEGPSGEIASWETPGPWLRADLPASPGSEEESLRALRATAGAETGPQAPAPLTLHLVGASGRGHRIAIPNVGRPPDSGSEAWDHRAGREKRGDPRPPPPVPWSVWAVIGAFLVVTGGIVATWLYGIR